VAIKKNFFLSVAGIHDIKNFLQSFSAFCFLKVYLHYFSKVKSQKEVTKQQESRFFLLPVG
jgi:hypothetical protein